MTDPSPGLKNRKVTYAASPQGIEKAEKAWKRLGFWSKIHFVSSSLVDGNLLSRSTVEKFFQGQSIQLDSFKRICEALTLNWQEIVQVYEEEQAARLEINKPSTSDNDESNSLNDKWRLVQEIVSQRVNARNLSGADLSDANLRGANLSDADLINADLSGADLINADLSGANLRGANLIDADLIGAYLSGANLMGANLMGANLMGANLIGTGLSGVNLSDTHLSDAGLIGANLSGANLRRAYLCYANLSGADLSGADVEKTQFGANLGLTEEMKLDLKQRGAIFEDSPGARSGVQEPSLTWNFLSLNGSC